MKGGNLTAHLQECSGPREQAHTDWGMSEKALMVLKNRHDPGLGHTTCLVFAMPPLSTMDASWVT